MIFEILILQVQQQRSPITTTNESTVRKIEVLSVLSVLSPEQQRSVITTTPVRKGKIQFNISEIAHTCIYKA
jgi:hypothetical protein